MSPPPRGKASPEAVAGDAPPADPASSAVQDAPGAPSPSHPAPSDAAWRHVPERNATQATRAVGLTIALLLLGVACIVAFYSAMRIASIWFQARYVPIAQLAVAGVTIAVCVLVVRRLRRPAAT